MRRSDGDSCLTDGPYDHYSFIWTTNKENKSCTAFQVTRLERGVFSWAANRSSWLQRSLEMMELDPRIGRHDKIKTCFDDIYIMWLY